MINILVGVPRRGCSSSSDHVSGLVFCVVILVLIVHLSFQSDEIHFTVEVLLNQERNV